jgi:hypothetical protein
MLLRGWQLSPLLPLHWIPHPPQLESEVTVVGLPPQQRLSGSLLS